MQLTTTYNELKELGACPKGLETLWKWLLKKNDHLSFHSPDTAVCCSEYHRLTPADILESNGVGFLNWVLARTPRWESSFYSWGGRWEGSFAWAKEVSGRVEPTKTLAKDLKGGDRIMFLGIERGVAGVYSKIGQITLNRVRGYTERFDLETLDAIGFTLIEPKREPRRLKAEQILVPENVGTKWRGHEATWEVVRCDKGFGLRCIATGLRLFLNSTSVALIFTEVIE